MRNSNSPRRHTILGSNKEQENASQPRRISERKMPSDRATRVHVALLVIVNGWTAGVCVGMRACRCKWEPICSCPFVSCMSLTLECVCGVRRVRFYASQENENVNKRNTTLERQQRKTSHLSLDCFIFFLCGILCLMCGSLCRHEVYLRRCGSWTESNGDCER